MISQQIGVAIGRRKVYEGSQEKLILVKML